MCVRHRHEVNGKYVHFASQYVNCQSLYVRDAARLLGFPVQITPVTWI
jgi:hypothetical protein